MISYDKRTNLYLDTEDEALMESLRKSSASSVDLRGGWMQGGALNGLAAKTGLDNEDLAYDNIDLDEERKKARLYFHFNFLISGAIDIVHSFTLGEQWTYGDIANDEIKSITEDFWVANDFQAMSERFMYEYLIDGENATLFPVGKSKINEPAIIAFPDVVNGFTVERDNVTRKFKVIKFNGIDGKFTPDNCVWNANKAFWNKFRGTPCVMQALDPAVAYIELLNHRIRIHELQGRLNAVYKAFVDYSQGPVDAMQQQQAKAAIFGRIPPHGGIITLAKNPATGESEDMTFLESGKGASDAEKDAKLLALGVATALGIPLTWVWTGESANRASGDSMTEPAKRSLGKRQAFVRNWADKVFRMETIRRKGKGFLVKTLGKTISSNKLTSTTKDVTVPIERYYFPWVFPSLELRDLAQQIAKVNIASRLKLASPQTLAGELGYDAALEGELLKAAGLNFGQVDISNPTVIGGNKK